MLEAVHRPSLEQVVENLFEAENLSFDTIILGHNHQAASRVFPGGKQYINTGTWTPITSLAMETLGHKVLRTYAFIEYVDGRARATLKVWHGSPQIAEDYF
jgi:UDP-2,3-diacylglucosamine pyrophosphatase LpxH